MPDQCYLSWNSIRVRMTEWLQYSENIELGLLNKQISSNFLIIQKQFVDLPTEAYSTFFFREGRHYDPFD